jgi:glucosamine--fructose-6-phosphate aminotransferase (isomerizing)
MCGIFGYVGKKNEGARIVFKGLKELEYRGYDSWGIASVTLKDPRKFYLIKKTGKIGNFDSSELPKSSLSLGHTRWATHGGVTQENAHPHLDCSQTIAVIHNGIIENFQEIKDPLLKEGHHFESETDTEVAAHLIEKFSKNSSFDEAVRKTFRQIKGLNAIAAINLKEKTIVAARNGSPLVVGFGRNENFLASDATALSPYTKEVYYLSENELAIISQEKIIIKNVISGKILTVRKQKIDWSYKDTTTGKYPHFMIKEINEQPKVLLNILENFEADVKRLANEIKKAEDIIWVGCGTAGNAALAGKYLFSKIAGVKSDAVLGSEFCYFGKNLDKKSLPIFLSQSGETIDIVQPASELKKRGIKIAALINRLGSSLYRISDTKILLGAGPEICVLSTKVFTAKLAVLLLTAFALKGKLSDGKRELESAIIQSQKILSKEYFEKYLKKLIPALKEKQNIFTIGRGLFYPIALEAALKIKEVTYLHVEGLAGGELKHGVIALIENGLPAIVFAPNDETYNDIISNATEIKARSGTIIGISHKNHEVFDYFLPLADSKEATIIPAIIIIHLIGYHLALALKRDPDKPRNLAKSVTVK